MKATSILVFLILLSFFFFYSCDSAFEVVLENKRNDTLQVKVYASHCDDSASISRGLPPYANRYFLSLRDLKNDSYLQRSIDSISGITTFTILPHQSIFLEGGRGIFCNGYFRFMEKIEISSKDFFLTAEKNGIRQLFVLNSSRFTLKLEE